MYNAKASASGDTKSRKRTAISAGSHPYRDQTKGMQGAVLILDRLIEREAIEKKCIRLEKLASIGELSANLAHELNNILDGVSRYVRLLLDQMPEDDSRRAYAEQAKYGLTRMSNMVRGLLDFSRKSTSSLSLIDIPQSIRRILSYFSEQISEQNIEVEIEFDENIPGVLSDVEQIFMNIIKNAIQAMSSEAPGGTLSISAKLIPPDLLEIRFSDTGPGIPDEIQEMIFNPFFTTKGSGQGVGLGLTISQGIAESYGGSIDLESELDKGTTFTVRLPLTYSHN